VQRHHQSRQALPQNDHQRKRQVLPALGYEPEFVHVTTTNSLGDLQKNTWSQVMGILNFTFGVALKFD
jgi:hypothetical protein